MATSHATDSTVIIQLTQNHVTVVDAMDADLASVKWCADEIASKTAYAIRVTYGSGKREKEYLHRAILSRILGRHLDATEEVDHIDGNGLNNRRSNLRHASKAQNGHNRGKNANNTSGYKGVSWDKNRNKWQAGIGYQGKRIALGRFDSAEAAHAVYVEAAQELHRDFANVD